jgi:hypothetical protein
LRAFGSALNVCLALSLNPLAKTRAKLQQRMANKLHTNQSLNKL